MTFRCAPIEKKGKKMVSGLHSSVVTQIKAAQSARELCIFKETPFFCGYVQSNPSFLFTPSVVDRPGYFVLSSEASIVLWVGGARINDQTPLFAYRLLSPLSK